MEYEITLHIDRDRSVIVTVDEYDGPTLVEVAEGADGTEWCDPVRTRRRTFAALEAALDWLRDEGLYTGDDVDELAPGHDVSWTVED